MKTRTLLIIGLVLLIAACGSTRSTATTEPSTVPPTLLEGHAFVATDVRGHEIVPGTRISIAFADDSLSVNAGCNSMGGAYHVNGDVLTVSDLATTEMGCDEARAAQDKWLGELLAAHPELVAGDKSITLKSGATVVKLTDKKIVFPDEPLLGTRWNVDTVITGETATNNPRPAWIEFSKNGHFKASNGCGQVEGTATVHGATITFRGDWTILAKCRGPIAPLPLGHFLNDTVHYELENDQLTLTAPGWGLGLLADLQYVGPPDCANC